MAHRSLYWSMQLLQLPGFGRIARPAQLRDLSYPEPGR